MKKIFIISIFVASLSFMIGCQKENTPEQTKEETSENTNTSIENKNIPFEQPATKDLTTLNEKGITINFSDGYKKTIQDGKEYILFGPLSTLNFGADPSQKIEPYHIYQLEFLNQRSAEKIMDEIKQKDEMIITIPPVIENINNFTVVKWAEGGMCESRNMEFVGEKTNIFLSSNGCQTESDTDFNYFKKIIENIKTIN